MNEVWDKFLLRGAIFYLILPFLQHFVPGACDSYANWNFSRPLSIAQEKGTPSYKWKLQIKK